MGVSSYKELVQLSTHVCWKKDVMVTPTLPRGKILDGVAPNNNRSSTNKDGGPKQLCPSLKIQLPSTSSLTVK